MMRPRTGRAGPDCSESLMHALVKRGLLALVLMTGPALAADGWRVREFLDSIDLNDYSLTLTFYGSQSLYAGIDNFKVLYPAPSTFDHATLTTDTFFVRDSYAGLRKVTDSGWTFGGVARVQTLGFGASDSAQLAGMARRSWTVEGGAQIGRRIGPVYADLFATTDLLDVHGGHELQFKLAWPLLVGRVQLVPQLQVNYQSADLVDYYFGVSEAEAAPGRPAYSPGSAVGYSAYTHLAWRFLPDWYMHFSVALDVVADEIRASPIVDRDTAWRVNLGVAYDGRKFVSTDDAGSDALDTHLDMTASVFSVSSKSMISLSANGPTTVTELESETGLEDGGTTYPLDIAWQFGRYHRVDLRYFELARRGTSTAIVPLTIDGVAFAPGELLQTSLTTRIMRFGYAFSFFRDAQKDLSVMGGAHVSDIDYFVQGDTMPVAASTTAILPVIGARLRVNPTERFAVHANAEIFNFDFNQYDGVLYDLSVSGSWRLAKRLFVGGGYSWYRQDIRSGDDDLVGEVLIDYRGPFAYLTVRF